MVLWIVMIISGCNLNNPAPKAEPSRAASNVQVEGVTVSGMTTIELNQILQQLAAEKYQQPVNAGFTDNGQIDAGKAGRRMNLGATIARIMAAPPDSNVAAVYEEIAPVIDWDQLSKAEKIGAYTSPILDTSPGRMQNIRLTAHLINNTIIEPGHEFSFNRITGEPTFERGFKEATIFADGGQHASGLGGGMCQVSSTLYNAVLAAGLTVTERHRHSQPVNYVPPDRDATTFTDKDFRFVNSTRRTVVVRAFEDEKQLIVDLWTLPK